MKVEGTAERHACRQVEVVPTLGVNVRTLRAWMGAMRPDRMGGA
jgi:hypothetical protein